MGNIFKNFTIIENIKKINFTRHVKYVLKYVHKLLEWGVKPVNREIIFNNHLTINSILSKGYDFRWFMSSKQKTHRSQT